MATATQLQQYCLDHGFSLKPGTLPTTAHQTIGHHAMNSLTGFTDWTKVGIWAAIIVGAYYVGRVGIPAVWTALKTDYSSIRNYFSGTKTTTPVATPTPAATPVAVS
jgi:hypothetical protein